ncbi:MAG: MFS transporter [Phototrophicaceae bacterium]
MITSTKQAKATGIVGASPIYYGWIVLIVAIIGVIATAPGQSFTVSLFIDFFIDEFDLSRTSVSALFSIATFVGSLSLTFVGQLIDRYGNRRMAVIIAALFSTVLVLFSFVTGPIGLLFGFLGIRMLGQGSLGLVNNTVIVEWFKRLRGRVMSIVLISFSVFQFFYIPFLQRQLEVLDWRTVWVYMGVAVACVTIPLTWIFMRNTPEEFGLLPDGDAVPSADAVPDLEAIIEDSWTLADVVKNPTFWVFVFGRIISPAWGTGLILHQISIFSELGHDARTAAANYATITIFTAIFAVIFGYLVDRLRPGIVMIIQLGALIAAMILATLMTSQILLWGYALSFGIMMGGGAVFDGAVWVNLFGRGHQGTIRGFVSTALVTGTAIGPILFGLSLDLMGSYSPVLWLGVILSVIAIIGAFIAPHPRKRKAKEY